MQEVENAGETSMESQNSRYLTLLQVGYNSHYVIQNDVTYLYICKNQCKKTS